MMQLTSNGELPASAISDSDDANTTFESGEDPIFNLGDIDNSNADNGQTESIIIEFNAVVENDADNQTGTVLGNSFVVTSSAASATPQESEPVFVEVLEPLINDVAQTANPNTGDGNDTVDFDRKFL